jgi:transcriptional regulator with XRE-family HTH domain
MDIQNNEDRHNYMIKRLRMDIAYQVRLIRLQRGLSQDQLAEKCHTEQPAIAVVENWNAPFPSVNTLKRIAEALDCALIVRLDNWNKVVGSLVAGFEADRYFTTA